MAKNFQAVEIPRFGGLDIRRDQNEDQGGARAINIRDIDFDMDGRIRQRPGTNKLVSVSGTSWQNIVGFNRSTLGFNSHVITLNSGTGELSAYDATNGTLVDTHTPVAPSLPAYLYDAVQIGTPTQAGTMYLVGAGWDQLVYYDGTTFSNYAPVYGGWRFLAVQYPDNRLVYGLLDSAPNYSRLYFSNPNNPTTYGANDYVDLMPGDGEAITGLCNYRDMVIAFKENAFYVFYGNSTDSTGGAVFNYRTIRHNLGTRRNFAGKTCVAGREGVYFICADGVYLTDGGYPKKISAPLDPLFGATKDPSGYFTAFNTTGNVGLYILELAYVDGRLYMTTSGDQVTGMSGRTFVYDPQLDAWSYWVVLNSRSSNLLGICPVTVSGAGAKQEVPYFLSTTMSGVTTRSVISYLDPTMIHDEDHDILVQLSPYYRTNFMDFGEAASMKRVREILLEGSLSNATVGLSVNNQLNDVPITDQVTTTLYSSGGSPVWPEARIGQGRMRKANRGQNFSISFSGVSWVVSRAVAHVDAPRPAGVRLLT
jgi:hypothetical protein